MSSTRVTKRATYPVRFKALGDPPAADGSSPGSGEFEALVSVYGNVDLIGDRVVAGAFDKSVEAWRESGDPIPIVWSHAWDNPEAHIGFADPADVESTPDGLVIKGRIDVDKPFARQVFDLMSARRVREWSFAYDVIDEAKADDGANDLRELALIEAGPTLKGINPATDTIDVKAARVVIAGLSAVDRDALAAAMGKAAIASHSTATSDAAWDGPAAESNLSNDAGAATYRKAYAWADPEGDPDAKSTYRFIHHEVGDDGSVGAANVRACQTAIGVLNGARGGSTIPDDDVAGVYAHVARHIRDSGGEPADLASADPDETKAIGTVFVDVVPRLKAGRMLSAKNEGRVRQAADLLGEVLSDLANTTSSDDGKAQDNGDAVGNPEDRIGPPSVVRTLAELAVLDG